MDSLSSISMISNQNSYTLQHTEDTFKALVDAIIPRTSRLAREYGRIQYFGALDLNTDEYMILTLNNYYIPLAIPTAEVLDIVAEELISLNEENTLLNFSKFPSGGAFAALTPLDRFRALTLLGEMEDDQANLSSQDNPEFVLSITTNLNRFTMLGYYSEWSGYGSTRLEAPDKRVLEYYPLSWQQVGYPGPSLGYRALRQ